MIWTRSWSAGLIGSALIALWFSSPAAGQAGGGAAGESLTYTLAPQFGQGRLKVEIVWQTQGRRQSALGVAPSFGRISDVPALLKDVQITGGDKVERQGPLWIVLHAQGAALKVDYVVSPGRRSFGDWDDAHRPIAAADFFHGVGNAFLMVPNSGPGTPTEFDAMLRWQLAAGNKAVCSWGVGRTIGARMTPYDLRHSVYFAGKLTTRTDTQDGRKVTVALADGLGFSAEQFSARTGGIIGEQCAFMAERDFPEFVVTAIPAGPSLREGETRLAGNGLYHSFALFMPPQAKLDDGFEHLFAHELFHHWNGGVLKAAQPERLAYWFVEGFTDYYALRILFESKRWDAATYAKWLNKHLREYATNPAIRATNEDIQRAYWTERDTVGQVAYQRGLLLGLRWHHAAKKKGVADGVDKLFHHLINRGRAGGFELSNEAFRSAGAQQLGPWFTSEFDAYVTRAEPIILPLDVLAPVLVGETVEVAAFELGFERERSLRDKKVRGLIAGSAAAAAGLKDGDQLTGWTIGNGSDEQVTLNVRRGRETLTVQYLPRGATRPALQFRVANQ